MSPSPEARASGSSVPIGLGPLLAVVAVSGACSLAYQVVWFRLFRQVFGSSTEATGVVVALFMGGLGLGGFLFGRRSLGMERPLGLYALVEGGIGLSAALTPLLLAAGHHAYLSLGGITGMGSIGALLVRFLLASLVMGPPTILMGGTLPLVAQVASVDRDAARRRVAWLYGCNTLGAVSGALVTTFFALELLGHRQTLWLAAAVNLLLAVWVRSRARTVPPEAEGQDEGESDPVQDGEDPETEEGGLLVPVLLAAAFAVGFVFFLMELVWYRMLAPILGGTSYTFGLILAMALLGIGLGGILYAFGSVGSRHGPMLLAGTCLLEAFALLVPWALGDTIALLAVSLRSLSFLGLPGFLFGWTVVTALVVLPASIIAGFQFPLLVGLLGRRASHVGRDVGLSYGFNTLGAVFGSLAGGFGLMPLLGAPALWRACGVALILTGVAIGIFAGFRKSLVLLGPATLFALLLVPAQGPSALWRHSGIGAGRLKAPANAADLLLVRWNHQDNVIAEIDGRESSVAVTGHDDRSLIVNGKSDGAVRGDEATTIMSGILPAALHPDPRSAFVLGWGTGTTAGWLAAVDSIEHVDVGEIEPAVIELASLLDGAAEGVLENPKVQIHLGDGRELLMTSGRRYDIIFSEPSNPYRAGVADLFSQDFYRTVRDRSLEPEGLFVQWLQGYELDADVFETVLATLGSVFDHVEVWKVGLADFALLASTSPVDHDAERLSVRLAEAPFRQALARAWGVGGVEGLYSGWIAGPQLAAAYRGLTVSTDDRPLVEYGFVRNVGNVGRFDEKEVHRAALQTGAAAPPASLRLDLDKLAEATSVRLSWGSWIGHPMVVSPTLPAPADQKRRTKARLAWHRRELDQAAELWGDNEATEHPGDRLLVAELQAAAGSAPDLGDLARDMPAAAALLAARSAWVQEQPEVAMGELEKAVEILRVAPWDCRPVLRELFVLPLDIAGTSPDRARRLFDLFAEQPLLDRQLNQKRVALLIDLAKRLPLEDRERQHRAISGAVGVLGWSEQTLTQLTALAVRWEAPEATTLLEKLESFRRTEARPLALSAPIEESASDASLSPAESQGVD